jgi:hypothetical protein
MNWYTIMGKTPAFCTVLWSFSLCLSHSTAHKPRLLLNKQTFVIKEINNPCNLKVVKYTMLPSFSPRDDRCVASHFFSVSTKVSSQGNLRRRSLKGALATTTGWCNNTHFALGFVYLFVAVHYRITTEYYKYYRVYPRHFNPRVHYSSYQNGVFPACLYYTVQTTYTRVLKKFYWPKFKFRATP